MKKTLIALMALAGVASAAEWIYETPTIASGTHTLSWNANGYNLNADLYNYLYGVFVEGGTVTFNLGINYTGGNVNYYQSLLHVGAKDTGFSIFANGTNALIISEKHKTSANGNPYELDAVKLSSGDNTVAITLTGDATTRTAAVSFVINGTTFANTNKDVHDLSWDNMAWNTSILESDTLSQAERYSVNTVAPGWTNYNADGTGSIKAAAVTTLTSGSVTFTQGTGAAVLVPEPATATLSLLALAGLCARRRRA